MSALNIITTRDGIHLFADTCGFDCDGRIVNFRSKLRAAPAASAALCGIGIGEIMFRVLDELAALPLLAEIVAALPEVTARAIADVTLPPGIPGRLELYAVGYGRGGAEIHNLKIFDVRVPAAVAMRRAPPGTWVFHPPPQADGLDALGADRARLEALNAKGEALPDAEAAEYAMLVLQAQRRQLNRSRGLNGDKGAYIVGGHAELVTIRPAGEIEARIIHVWPDDTIGRQIAPEPYQPRKAAA